MTKKAKILIIDDDASVRNLVSSILNPDHYECFEAPSGAEGLRAAREHLPDLILCDVQMPEMDGYAVFQALSEDSATRKIPFIFLTGEGTHENVRKGMAAGADDYLTKPFTQEELLNSVQTRLAKKQQTDSDLRTAVTHTKFKFMRTAYFDPITGLPNHMMLDHRCHKLIKASTAGTGFGIVLINIDHLRTINQAFGRQTGDAVLRFVGNRSKQILRSGDYLFHGGSDDFTVLLSGTSRQEHAEEFLKRVLHNLNEPFQFDSKELRISVSMGFSYYDSKEDHSKTVLDQAETAMYYASDRGGRAYCFYQPEMHQRAFDRAILESHLRQALKREELLLFYQPQVEIGTGQIKGMEALIRWKHPEMGFISPLQFIPIAEESGLILDIGRWVLETACRQNNRRLENPPLRIAVNLSGNQFQGGDLAAQIKNLLQATSFPPECLELEITESLLMKNVAATLKQLKEFKAMGITLAIDDFGTGFSSLAYLKQFPVNVLKIDRLFVREVASNPTDTEIASTIIDMAHHLKLRVLAEGVETQEQLDTLRRLGCEEFQGFLFSRPVPMSDFEKLFTKP